MRRAAGAVVSLRVTYAEPASLTTPGTAIRCSADGPSATTGRKPKTWRQRRSRHRVPRDSPHRRRCRSTGAHTDDRATRGGDCSCSTEGPEPTTRTCCRSSSSSSDEFRAGDVRPARRREIEGGGAGATSRGGRTWRTSRRSSANSHWNPCTILGYSWGGLLALLHAIEAANGRVAAPPARLVLIDPAPVSRRLRDRFEAEFARRQRRTRDPALRADLAASGPQGARPGRVSAARVRAERRRLLRRPGSRRRPHAVPRHRTRAAVRLGESGRLRSHRRTRGRALPRARRARAAGSDPDRKLRIARGRARRRVRAAG